MILEWFVKEFIGDGDLLLLFPQAIATQDSPSFTRIFKLLIIKGRTCTFISSGNFHVYSSQRVVKSTTREERIFIFSYQNLYSSFVSLLNCMFRFCKWRGCGKEWWYAQLAPSIFSIVVLCGGFFWQPTIKRGVGLHFLRNPPGEKHKLSNCYSLGTSKYSHVLQNGGTPYAAPPTPKWVESGEFERPKIIFQETESLNYTNQTRNFKKFYWQQMTFLLEIFNI